MNELLGATSTKPANKQRTSDKPSTDPSEMDVGSAVDSGKDAHGSSSTETSSTKGKFRSIDEEADALAAEAELEAAARAERRRKELEEKAEIDSIMELACRGGFEDAFVDFEPSTATTAAETKFFLHCSFIYKLLG